MRKDFSNMDGVVEQFDAVTTITPIGDRIDVDNFYNATSNVGKNIQKAMDARQKRKATQAKAQLAASKGLAKSAENDKQLLRVLSTTKKEENKKGLSTFAKVGIGVGVAAVIGLGAYFLLKKK